VQLAALVAALHTTGQGVLDRTMIPIQHLLYKTHHVTYYMQVVLRIRAGCKLSVPYTCGCAGCASTGHSQDVAAGPVPFEGGSRDIQVRGGAGFVGVYALGPC
jgi:hypothetical protein